MRVRSTSYLSALRAYHWNIQEACKLYNVEPGTKVFRKNNPKYQAGFLCKGLHDDYGWRYYLSQLNSELENNTDRKTLQAS